MAVEEAAGQRHGEALAMLDAVYGEYLAARNWLSTNRPDLFATLPHVDVTASRPTDSELRDHAQATASVYAALIAEETAPAGGTSGPGAAGDSASVAMAGLLTLYTNGVSDDRLRRAVGVVNDSKLTANDKLAKLNQALTIPATATAGGLAKLLGVSKPAVLKTPWWIENRRGEKASEVGRRRRRHQAARPRRR